MRSVAMTKTAWLIGGSVLFSGIGLASCDAVLGLGNLKDAPALDASVESGAGPAEDATVGNDGTAPVTGEDSGGADSGGGSGNDDGGPGADSGGGGGGCKSGAACTPATFVCHKGIVSCTSGVPVCEDTNSSADNGASCGTNQVCDNGTCVSCEAGTSCTPENPCHVGATSCGSGTSVCVDTDAAVSNGASCGTDKVCGGGVCNACNANTSCTPADNVCHAGTIACASGAPTCTDTGAFLDSGTVCDAGDYCFGVVIPSSNGFPPTLGVTCAPGCLVSGQAYENGAVDPGNGCLSCEVGTSTAAFTGTPGKACPVGVDGGPSTCVCAFIGGHDICGCGAAL